MESTQQESADVSPTDSTLQAAIISANAAKRAAWIGGAAAVLAAASAAVLGPWFSFLGAQSGATAAPAVRIDSVEWQAPDRHEFTVTGTAQNLADDVRVWGFSAIRAGTGQQYATADDCAVYSDGTFTCKGYAGDVGEGGQDFSITVTAVSTKQADEIRDRVGTPYASLRDIPVSEGGWALHSLTMFRPHPDGP